MSESLYKLTEQFLEVKKQLEEMEDLDPMVIDDTLEAYKGDIYDKAENIAKYIRTLDYSAINKKAEAKRLTESAKKDTAKAQSLMNYLFNMLDRADLRELSAGVFTFKVKQGSEVVEIDESKLPSWKDRKDLYDVKPIFKYSKPELKEMLKKGETIPGVSIVRNPEKLVMK